MSCGGIPCLKGSYADGTWVEFSVNGRRKDAMNDPLPESKIAENRSTCGKNAREQLGVILSVVSQLNGVVT